MKALVVNCSYEPGRKTAGSISGYNLGAAKLANWLRSEGHDVTEWGGDPGMFAQGYDLVALSVVFSWHAPIAAQIAFRVRGNSDVWCGGPGIFVLGNWWQEETGLGPTIGLDKRFDRERSEYLMTFASRGCPVGCSFCIVPRYEGRAFTLDPEFTPAPVLCDNNLSALPQEYQDHVIQRYRETNTQLHDANSGFEPRAFTADTYHRWKDILKGPWRFAFDVLEGPKGEEGYVRDMMQVLRDVPASRKRVYVLIGNEPIDACYYRAQKVIEWGGEPYCQPVMRLNAMSRDDLWVRHNWTKQKLKDFARYYNRWLWRAMPIEDYKPRSGEPEPFRAPTPPGAGRGKERE